MADTVEDILAAWPADQPETRRAFAFLAQRAAEAPGTSLAVVSRPGVSHSLRAALPRNRPVYFLVDVVVSESDPWFLSACFYADEVADPRELGNAIPQGLFDETGYCFDVEDDDLDFLNYIAGRILEAHAAASADSGLEEGVEKRVI